MDQPRSTTQSGDGKSDDSHMEKNPRVQEPEAAKKQSLPKRIWSSLGLNIGMIIMMVKGALPPAISIALYQWTAFANHFSTLGYLVAVMATLSFAIMPRAKFFQTMTFNVLGICIGAAITVLQIYCAVEARAHTSPPQPKPSGGAPSPGAQVAGYNSSASAVCAIWLFFNIYVANLLRASRPQLQFPVIMYSVFTNVASTFAPQFSTMAQGIAFVKRLLEAFMAGFGIAAIVSFLIFPMTSREVFLKQAAGYISALQGALKAQSNYLCSLENPDVLGTPDKEDFQETDKDLPASRQTQTHKPKLTPEAAALKAAVGAVGELYGKLSTDIAFAKREFGYCKLDASDFGELVRLLRMIMIPVMGMSSIADIFDRIADRRGWRESATGTLEEKEALKKTKDIEKSNWSKIMKSLHDPFDVLTASMDEGLRHALYTLELGKSPKSGKNETGTEGSPRVGVPRLYPVIHSKYQDILWDHCSKAPLLQYIAKADIVIPSLTSRPKAIWFSQAKKGSRTI